MEYKEPIVENIKVAYLRKNGYINLIKWLESPDHMYIGRQMQYVNGATDSKWKNPFPVEKYGRDKCLELYEKYIRDTPELWNSIEELNHMCLGCWCVPERCHGHILQKLFNEKIALKREPLKENTIVEPLK